MAGGTMTRRSLLRGALGLGAASLVGCTNGIERSGPSATRSLTPKPTPKPTPPPSPVDCETPTAGDGSRPLWSTAMEGGLVYGSSTATWQISDAEYRRLFAREAAILFTEDDLLWYRLRPTPDADLDFRFGDRIIGFAEDNGMLTLGAHLVWDEGFGEGWTEDDLWGLDEQAARDLLFGTLQAVVQRYRGRVAAWIVANEVFDAFGMRAEVPWYGTIGPTYVAEAFHLAHEADPDALLILNDFGFETDDEFSPAADKRAVALQVLDELLGDDVPVHALGVQAHLTSGGFAERFDPEAYRRFLAEVAERDLKILITEMDVLDDGSPPQVQGRDREVAETYRRYLDVALDEPAVVSLVTFGLSDRYTWLQEDYPREDGAPRRPLPFDEELTPKPSFTALASSLQQLPLRDAAWVPPRC
jgi:endo-1,4-beta-xylanase